MSDRCEPTPDPAPPLPLPEAPEAEPTDVDPEVEPFATVFPAGSYAARVVADGATAYWRLGEASGTVANDAIGTAHGTISGGVTLGQPSPLRDGNAAMLFNGSTGKVVTAATVTVPVVVTVEAWVMMTGIQQRPIFDTGVAGGDVFVGVTGGTGFVFSDAGATGTRLVNDGRWHHLVVVLTGTTTTFYVDGTLDRAIAQVRTVPSVKVAHLGWSSDTAEFWNGALDEVAIYPTALSADTIAAHYALRLWYAPFTPGSYPARVVADGASHFWRLGDGAGTQATEVLAGAHGTISGGVTLNAAGALLDGDKAMVFNGSTGKIETAATLTVPVTCTVEAWVKTSVAGTSKDIFSTRMAGSSGGVFEVYLDASQRLGTYVGIGTGVGVRSLGDGRWHHVVCVYQAGSGVLYVDGVVDSTGGFATLASPSVGRVSIGWDTQNPQFMNGSLDEVAIYPTALSAATIAAHYALRAYPLTGYPATVIQAGASNYWRLGESAGTTAVDIISGANGTISGGVTLGQPGGVPGDTAMVFNGTTGKVVTAALTLPLTGTVEVWLKTTNAADFKPIVANRTGGVGVLLCTRSGGRLSYFSDVSTPQAVTASPGTVLGDGNWHHIAYVFTATTLTFYVDGRVDGSAALTQAASTSLALGLGFDPAGGFWSGSLDEVAIYPRALAPSEVAAHYAAGTTLPPGDKTTEFVMWQRQNNAWNNEQIAAVLGGFKPNDLTTVVSRFIWGNYASTQNVDAAHSRYQNMVLADGASHFWRLSDSGTTAVDIAGGVSGTLSGGVTTGAAGAFSGDTAMTFDGVDDRIATVANVAIVPPFSFEVWAKTAVGTNLVFFSNLLNNVYGFVIGTDAARLLIYHEGGGVSRGVGVKLINDNQWHHIVFVVLGGAWSAYIDGISESLFTQPTTALPGSSLFPANIGYDPSFGGKWTGSLDDVAVYPRALSAAEVARHYAARG